MAKLTWGLSQQMMADLSKEPPPFGIPNRIGNTCWFQSATQCIFRNPDLRRKIMTFDPETLQIDQDMDSLRTFRLLIDHFKDLIDCNSAISNVELVKALRSPNGTPLFTEQQSSGKDSYYAVEAYFTLFSALVGDMKPGLHSFSSPLGDLLSLYNVHTRAGSEPTMIPAYYFILNDAENNQTAMLAHLPELFFLPKVLVMRHDRSSDSMTHPDPVIFLPEPLDYVVADRDLSKCKTKVKYELYATVIYQGPNADHAIAFLKMADSRKWFIFNDQTAEEKGDDSTLKDAKWLTSEFNWPALFFYRRLDGCFK